MQFQVGQPLDKQYVAGARNPEFLAAAARFNVESILARSFFDS